MSMSWEETRLKREKKIGRDMLEQRDGVFRTIGYFSLRYRQRGPVRKTGGWMWQMHSTSPSQT